MWTAAAGYLAAGTKPTRHCIHSETNEEEPDGAGNPPTLLSIEPQDYMDQNVLWCRQEEKGRQQQQEQQLTNSFTADKSSASVTANSTNTKSPVESQSFSVTLSTITAFPSMPLLVHTGDAPSISGRDEERLQIQHQRKKAIFDWFTLFSCETFVSVFKMIEKHTGTTPPLHMTPPLW